MKLRHTIAIGASACALLATPALADKARQLGDLVDSRASSAEGQLQSRGFKHISTHKSSRGVATSYWWDERDDDCVQVRVRDGRVQRINDATDQDCGHHKGSEAATALGVIAGAALIGALTKHKSHHREGKDYDTGQTNEFERGYKDGLHHTEYHNYNRSDAYSHGYEEGSDERRANLGHHHGGAGYRPSVQYRDVEGMRGPRARDVLRERGFVRVNRFGDDNTRYSILWRSKSRQCLQLTIADGRAYDVRDIGNHPDCRG